MVKTKQELNKLLDTANQLQQEHETCPECEENYEHTDVTKGGEIVFVHGNATPSTADCCNYTGETE